MLTQHEIRRIAVTAETDPRTVRRVLTGMPVQGLSRMRIERAMRELGIVTPTH